jgi:hypothetical protein
MVADAARDPITTKHTECDRLVQVVASDVALARARPALVVSNLLPGTHALGNVHARGPVFGAQCTQPPGCYRIVTAPLSRLRIQRESPGRPRCLS